MFCFKRILSLILCFILLSATVACDSGNTNNVESDDDFVSGNTDTSSKNDVYSEDSEESSETEFSYESSAEISSDTSYESSEYNSVDSSDDTTEDVSIDNGDRFSVIGPTLELNKVWENGKMELYNTEFRISAELEKKLAAQFSSFSNPQSVALIELDTNMAFFFDKDQKIATASSIKGPMALYAYKCIDDGVIGWDTVKTYQAWHYQANSTGWVQNSPFGTGFNVKTLMDYMIRISDNQAYLMIKELVGVENFESMMSALGSSRIIPQGSNWGYITAFEMAAVWREIYYYSLSSESGAELFDRFMHAQYNYIWRAIPQYEAAHKSGWSGKAFNDAGVVFADGHQYVLVGLMGRSGIEDQRSQYQFNAVARLLAELMVEYNAYLDEGISSETTEESEN